jgi:hypothetical protein
MFMASLPGQSIHPSRHARASSGHHALCLSTKPDVDARDRPGHDKDQFQPIFLGHFLGLLSRPAASFQGENAATLG